MKITIKIENEKKQNFVVKTTTSAFNIDPRCDLIHI